MKKPVLLLLLLLAVIAVLFFWSTQGALSPAPMEEGHGKAAIGGAFTLTDQHGETVRDSDFRGRLMLVFFGFTHCPDICPVSVANLSAMMELLGEDANQVAPVFITVDPARDTPQAMKDYLANFDKRMVGLTGTPEQIQQAAAAYKVYHARSQPAPQAHGHADGGHEAHDGGGDYMVDHSGFIYLMDRDGTYVRHFPYNASPAELADAVKPLLN